MPSTSITCYNEHHIDWERSFLPINAHDIHVHTFIISDNIELINKHAHLIKEIEWEKSEKFCHKEDAQRYLLARICCRQLLAKYNAIASDQLQYETDAFHKPIATTINNKKLQVPYFNWSHSNDRLLIGFAKQNIGADIEYIKEIDYDAILEASFYRDEIHFIKNSENKIKDFYTLWTRKEAVLKCLGSGLSEEMNKICLLDGENSISLDAATPRATYRVHSFAIGSTYIASIACENEGLQNIVYFSLHKEAIL